MMAGQAHGVEEDTTVQLFTSKASKETEGYPATIMKIDAFRSELELFSTINAEVLYAQLRHSFSLAVMHLKSDVKRPIATMATRVRRASVAAVRIDSISHCHRCLQNLCRHCTCIIVPSGFLSAVYPQMMVDELADCLRYKRA